MNIVVAAVLAFLFVLGCYSLWDSHNVEAKASAVQWQPYKPAEPEPLSFRKLQKLNPDVVSWLTVYGTGIDYPVCYNQQYDYYLSRTPTGEYSLTGSLFLDDRNSPDFSDFNTIVYGHHMDARVMFGPISNFEDQRYFNEHEYGNLFSQERDWGIHFFAYVKVDAYDKSIYRTSFNTDEDRQDYLDLIRQRATRTRDVEVGPSDRIIVLSTCSSDSTNGRTILVGKISDNVYEDTFITWPNVGTGIDESLSFLGIPWFAWLAVALWLLLLIALIVGTMRQRRRDQKEQTSAEADAERPKDTQEETIAGQSPATGHDDAAQEPREP